MGYKSDIEIAQECEMLPITFNICYDSVGCSFFNHVYTGDSVTVCALPFLL